MLLEIMGLTLGVQVVLASGWIGNAIGSAGFRRDQGPLETIFRTLVFGLPATGIMAFTPPVGGEGFAYVVLASAAVLSGVTLGVAWRKAGKRLYERTLKALGLAVSNERNDAWLGYIHDDLYGVDTVQLHLKGGRGLICDDLVRFAEAPHGPIVFGNNRSVILYVTRIKPDAESAWEDSEDYFDPDRGWTSTYVPADQIEEITVTKR